MVRAIRTAAGTRQQKAEKSMRRSSYVFLLCMVVGALIGVATADALQASTSTPAVDLFKGTVTLQQPAEWSLIQYSLSYELIHATSQQLEKLSPPERDKLPKINIWRESLPDHAAVLKRLLEIAAESSAVPQFSTIAGWPALQRSQLIPKPQRGQGVGQESAAAPVLLRHITIAIAADNLLLRLDGFAEPDLSTFLWKEMQQIAGGLHFRVAADQSRVNQEVQELRRAPSPRTLPPARNLLDRSGQALPATGDLTSATSSTSSIGAASVNLQITTEPEVSASTNGQNIVAAAQCSFKTSNDGGQTFPSGGGMPHCNGGDSSLGFGRSGNFYEATIGPRTACTTDCGTSINATAINRSTNNGNTFSFVINAFDCTAGDPCGFGSVPDQEHLAADRFNAATAGDQVYVAIREGFGYDLACSTDSGGTWPTKTGVVNSGSTDFPRVTVGQDGSLYVVTQNGGNVELDKYSSCATGLTLQFHRTVATGVNFVTCPVPGLDRCNNGNNLSSFMVAVDDTNASHVYVAYAVNTSSGVNENVIIQDSTDGGNTWTRPAVQINNSITARRYMPWVCSVGGAAYVSWYDRRASTPCPTPPCAANNDLADYFAASASLDGNGNLLPGTEFQIDAPGTSDPECAGGATPGSAQSWPCGARATADASSCSFQPQLAGRCFSSGNTCGTPAPVGSGQACDLNTGLPACPTGETCVTGLGSPKYGDYNGNTCAAGRVYTVWGSGTSQPGTTPANGINLFFAEKLVCCVPQIQSPGPLSMTTCLGTTTTTTANICNTGKADLQINSITPGNGQFSVATPSSGFPVTISPDSCFPFQVNFTPTGTGTTNASLTVASSDTVNPSITIPVSGTSPAPSVNATIANSGTFGNVCAGNQADLNLQLLNQGQCNLNITSISSSNPGTFVLPAGVTFPITLSADANVNVPIRFVPSGVCSDTVSQTANITIASNDPSRPSLVQGVSGIEGCPKMVLSPQNLSGTFAFPATVSDPTGTLGCYTDRQITVSNAGICPLNITNLVTSNGLDGIGAPLPASPREFAVVNPTLPISIAPGAAPVPITVRFKPVILTDQNPMAPDQQTGTLSIISNDPVAADNTAGLCGEPTYHSGARVLIVNSLSNPVSSVAQLTLSSKGLTPPFSEKLMPAALQATPNICGNTILWHLDNETLRPAGTTGSNPLASYSLSAKNGSTHADMSFTLGQCQMQQIVLQVK